MKGRIRRIGSRIGKDIKEYKEVLVIVDVYYLFMHLIFHGFCPLVLTTGFPCAGCGMTRAVLCLLTGQLTRSWNLNPAALPLLLFAGYCAVTRYLFGRKVKGFKAGLTVLCVFMVSAYIYRMLTVFPDHPPYSYTRGNLLEKLIPYYREILRGVLGI